MNFLITGIPADPPDDDRLEPGSTATDEAAPGNQYLSKKDFKILFWVLVIGALVFYPLIRRSYDERLRYDCGQNFKAITASFGIYMANYDDRYPPTYATGQNSMEPFQDGKGRPYTWASTLVNIAGFDPKRTFTCPAATSAEVMMAEGAPNKLTGEAADLPMTYGMYAPFGLVERSAAASPGLCVLVTETASGGANDTRDPFPMAATGGKIRDGFLIGWDTGDQPFPQGKYPPPVTRLAIPGSSKGLSSRLTQGRHDDSQYVLFADLHYQLVKVGRLSERQYWALPK